ncbi:MAG: hypothetical protein IAF02_00485 [Anaerolineae bacterium]|nr:hypothetical protein [Anaerolineae bacterium]
MEQITQSMRIKSMKPHLFLRPVLFIVLLSILAGSVMPMLAQESNGVTMGVQAGYEGYYKAGSLLPVIVTVANDGAPIEGELRIVQGSTTTGNRVVYNTPISLPTQSNKRVLMYVYPADFSTDLKVELLDENGRSLLKTSANPIRQLPKDSLLYGIVTPEPGNLDYLEDVTGNRSEAAVAYLNLDTLPDLPPAWSSLDVLVLHDVDTGQLSAAQVAALTAWINTGGQLVVAGGAGWQKTATALADMLPVAITGSETMADLPALQAATGEPFRDPGPYLVTTSSLTNGELLLHEDGLPLLAQRPFGQGSVTFLALDPSLAPLLDWAGSEIVWANVADGVPTLSPWSDGFQNSWAAVSAVSSLPTLAMPPVLQLAAYLLIYILVIGPLNYVILKRKNRRELAWVTIPILVIFFSGAAYLTGFQLKGNDTIINQMSVAVGEVGSEDVRVNTLLGLYSPRRRSYNMVLPAASMARPITENFDGRGSSVEAVTRGSEVVLTDVRVDVSGVETFVAESVQPMLPITGKGTLQVNNGNIELTASVRNDSDQALEDVTLLISAYAVALGDMAPGQAVSTTEIVGTVDNSGALSFNPSGYGSPLMQNASTILGTSNYYDDREAYPRYMLLQALEDEYLAGSSLTANNTLMLTFWTDEVLLETAVQNQTHNTASTTLYLLELPLQDDLNGTMLAVPLDLLNWTILGSNNMYSESVRDFYMPESSWVEVEFTPWTQFANMAVTDVAVQLASQSGQTSAPVPAVRLWDWQTGEWVDLDDVVWGETAVPDPQRFLTKDNTIRLRLQNKSQTGLDIHEFYPLLTGELN